MNPWQTFWHWMGVHNFGVWTDPEKYFGGFWIQTRKCRVCNIVEERIK